MNVELSPEKIRALQSGYQRLSALNLYHAKHAGRANSVFEPVNRYSTNEINSALVDMRVFMRACEIHVPSGSDEI